MQPINGFRLADWLRQMILETSFTKSIFIVFTITVIILLAILETRIRVLLYTKIGDICN